MSRISCKFCPNLATLINDIPSYVFMSTHCDNSDGSTLALSNTTEQRYIENWSKQADSPDTVWLYCMLLTVKRLLQGYSKNLLDSSL